MVEVKGTVTLKDGSALPFEGGPFETMMAEQYLHKKHLGSVQDSPMTWSMYVAYLACGGDGYGFETWAKTVAAVDLDTADARPTNAEPSDG